LGLVLTWVPLLWVLYRFGLPYTAPLHWETQPALSGPHRNQGVIDFSDHFHKQTGVRGAFAFRDASGRVFRREYQTRTQDRVRLASLSKQFVAALYLRLNQERVLDLDDPICAHWKESCESELGPVTFHQLLSMSSGLRRDGPTFFSNGFFTNFYVLTRRHISPGTEGVLADALRSNLNSLPGVRFRYSNFGYQVLSALAEKIVGRPFSWVMRERVFAPAGLSDTGLISRDSKLVQHFERGPDLLSGLKIRNRPDPKYLELFEFDFEGSLGAGGFYSTVEDLLKWDEVLRSGRLIPRALFRKATQEVIDGYGYGWVVEKGGAHWHNGELVGNYAFMFRDRSRTFVYLSNTGYRAWSAIQPFQKELRQAIRGVEFRSLKTQLTK
jgi:CubicO group peptidase (beta-lactamase class C family)